MFMNNQIVCQPCDTFDDINSIIHKTGTLYANYTVKLFIVFINEYYRSNMTWLIRISVQQDTKREENIILT